MVISLKKILIVPMLLAAFTLSAQQTESQPKWGSSQTSRAAEAEAQRIAAEPLPAVAVQDMYVQVVLDQPAAVKLFTILGQPVVQLQLPAGSSRFKVPARGIYILKIGSTTRRITI